MRTWAVASLALWASVVAAETTLYIPGFDAQAITADIEGVDDQGRTTWRIGPGVPSGTYEDAPGIIHSATLVAGPTDAQLVYDDSALGLSMSEGCGISNGLALCTVVASGDEGLQTYTVQETATGFVVQGNAAAPTNPPTSPGDGANPPSGATPTVEVTPVETPTETGATQTGADNSAERIASAMGVSMGVVILFTAFFL